MRALCAHGAPERFARANAAPERPNRSALKQLRTNDFVLGRPWELREFQIADSHLREVTVQQTPDLTLLQESRLADYVNRHATDINEDKHRVEVAFPAGNHFLGGSSVAPEPGFFWDHRGPAGSSLITNREARRRFSFNTCNGCHTGETRTDFTHIKPETPIGRAAGLSRFMTGDPASPDKVIEVPDPSGSDLAPGRFNDLLRRQEDLDKLVGDGTRGAPGVLSAAMANELAREPLRMVH